MDDNVGDGHFAAQADEYGMSGRYVGTGRTIGLAPFEFARFDIGLSVHHDGEVDDKLLYDALVDVVTWMAEREEASIEGKDVDAIPMPQESMGMVNGCRARYLTVAYGLTLQGNKKFESHRIDDAWKYQIDDGVDIVEAYETIGNEMGFRLDERRRKIRGDDSGGAGL